MTKCLFSYDIWWVMNNFCYIDFYNFWQDESKNLYILENTLKILKFIYNILVFVPISKPLNLMSWKTLIYSLVAHYKLIFTAPVRSTVAVNKSKCMYRVWCVKFKGSLLVEAVQSWPLIGRHVKGDLAGSSYVTVLKLGWAGFGKQLYTPLGTAFFALRDWQRIQSDGLGWKKYFKEIFKIHFQIILTLLQPVLSNKCPRACLVNHFSPHHAQHCEVILHQLPPLPPLPHCPREEHALPGPGDIEMLLVAWWGAWPWGTYDGATM